YLHDPREVRAIPGPMPSARQLKRQGRALLWRWLVPFSSKLPLCNCAWLNRPAPAWSYRWQYEVSVACAMTRNPETRSRKSRLSEGTSLLTPANAIGYADQLYA